MALKIREDLGRTMHWAKGVLASMVLLCVILQVTTRSKAADKRLLVADGSKQAIAAGVVAASGVNAARLFENGPLADSSSSAITYFDSEKVAAAFAKGGVLFDGNGAERNYSIHTSRRDKPGEAEIHALDTDIVYVLEGTATFVTGGTVVNARTIRPNEIRAVAIEGGETHQLSKGDVYIVPKGVPHWCKGVQSPFLYFLVKVR